VKNEKTSNNTITNSKESQTGFPKENVHQWRQGGYSAPSSERPQAIVPLTPFTEITQLLSEEEGFCGDESSLKKERPGSLCE
jgi:hypothetical protein